MSPSSALDATKDLGVRFRFVGLLPTAALVFAVLAVAWSGAPGRAPDAHRVTAHVDHLSSGEGVALVLAILVAALILEPLQFSLVRVLEGYWGESRLGRLLAAPGIAYHGWRRSRLEDRQRREGDRVDRRAEREAAARRLRRYPPADAVLPTGLGNVLRAAELRAGERYGLDSLVIWPRLYPVLGEQVRALADDRRDQLDLSVRFCVMFAVATAVLLALLAPYGWWLAVPAGTFALAWLSYSAAIAAAAEYGEALETAFDLHRFDLLRALHLPLPNDSRRSRTPMSSSRPSCASRSSTRIGCGTTGRPATSAICTRMVTRAAMVSRGVLSGSVLKDLARLVHLE